MSTVDTAVAAPDRRSGGRHDWKMLAALGITQTVGYGVLFYAFAVYLVPMAAALHTSTATITGALTLGILTAAGAALPVVRWLDRHGGRGLMTFGSFLGTLAIVGWSRVDSVAALYVVFAVIGIASAMVLYEPAFAVIVSVTSAPRRAGALLAVTIVAGFASSIFIPLTGVLVATVGWRDSLLILAAIHGAITIPLHALAVPNRRNATTTDAEPSRFSPTWEPSRSAGTDSSQRSPAESCSEPRRDAAWPNPSGSPRRSDCRPRSWCGRSSVLSSSGNYSPTN